MSKVKSEKTETKKTKISSDAFPRRLLENAIPIAKIIRDTYANKPTTWKEIAKALGVSEKNAVNRYPVWAASAYGLINKEDNNTYTLAETGRKILAPNYENEDVEGIFKSLHNPQVLSKFYTDYNGSALPSDELFLNVLENRYGVPKERTKEAKEIIIKNAEFAKALHKDIDGKIHLKFQNTPVQTSAILTPSESESEFVASDSKESIDYASVCFIITPLGEDGSVERKHADTVLKHLIEPVLKEYKLLAVRADKISKPGIITQQIIEHIAKAKLCIADLSFSNPNAFYELGVRHSFKLPTIQIIKKGDKIPFDVSQGRTIIIDTSDPYTIMDRFDSGRRELKEHISACVSGKEKPEDNPINLFLPGLKVVIPK